MTATASRMQRDAVAVPMPNRQQVSVAAPRMRQGDGPHSAQPPRADLPFGHPVQPAVTTARPEKAQWFAQVERRAEHQRGHRRPFQRFVTQRLRPPARRGVGQFLKGFGRGVGRRLIGFARSVGQSRTSP